MEFERPLPTMVSIDTLEGATVTDKDTEIWKYTRRFDAMRAGAPAPRDTPRFLGQAARQLEES